MTTLALPMNPLSILFPVAPGEEAERHADAPVPDHRRVPTIMPNGSGRDSIRDRYRAGQLTFEQAIERLHRFGMSWTDAGEFLEDDAP